jgi:DNA-binding protein H-NS
MPSYEELMNKAQKLMDEAEKIKRKEIDRVVAEIRETMKTYGLTARDLGPTEARAKKTKRAAKYRGPNGELWSGGRGRKPKWVLELLAQGKSTDDFKIK